MRWFFEKFFSILGWCIAGLFFKGAAEGLEVEVAQLLGNFRNGKAVEFHQLLGTLDSAIADMLLQGDAGLILKKMGKVAGAIAYPCGYHLHGERFCGVIIDIFHQPIKQLACILDAGSIVRRSGIIGENTVAGKDQSGEAGFRHQEIGRLLSVKFIDAMAKGFIDMIISLGKMRAFLGKERKILCQRGILAGGQVEANIGIVQLLALGGPNGMDSLGGGKNQVSLPYLDTLSVMLKPAVALNNIAELVAALVMGRDFGGRLQAKLADLKELPTPQLHRLQKEGMIVMKSSS